MRGDTGDVRGPWVVDVDGGGGVCDVLGHLLGENVEDLVDGADKVELDDCAPGSAFCFPCLGCERELEI